MTTFLKAMLIICAKSHIFHFDFTTPKGRLQAMQKRKKGKDSNKRKTNEWKKKD